MLRGWKNYQDHGMVYPASLQEQLEVFKAECDLYGEFFSTFFTRKPEASITRDNAYKLFISWYRQHNPSAGIPNATTFAREARRSGLGEKIVHGQRHWVGIEPNEQYQEWWA